jgi:hypothetical protein
MISSEVQRTLVKSPPELWAELSDPESLARHLGELGEIRITRIDPEQTVEWEAEDTTGTIRIKPSGWGTKVTLKVTREIPTLEPPIELTPELVVGAEAEPAVEEPAPVVLVNAAPEPQAAVVEEPELVIATEEPPELEPRRRFFARLFHRRRRYEAVKPGSPEVIATMGPTFEAVESNEPAAPQEPQDEEAPEDNHDISAELKAAEEIAAEHVTAVLTSVLDRLGAAHHRPFSRA